MGLSIQFQFFCEKILSAQKRKSTQKPTNKTKTSKQKTTKATIFRAEKLLRGGKLFILRFLKKIEIVLITSFSILLKISSF